MIAYQTHFQKCSSEWKNALNLMCLYRFVKQESIENGLIGTFVNDS